MLVHKVVQNRSHEKIKQYRKYLSALVFLSLYTTWPLLIIALWPSSLMGDVDRFSAFMLALCVYSLPAVVSSLISGVVQFFKNAQSATYTFLTLNLVIISIAGSILIK